MRNRALPCLIASVALAACLENGGGSSAILTVQNQSDFVIVDIRVAATNAPSFGPNLLGADTLNPGDELALGVGCGVFDARVIDAAGAECDLSAIDLCANGAIWVVSDQTCPVFALRGGQLTPAENERPD